MNIPGLPDSIPKLLTYLGIALMVSLIISFLGENRDYEKMRIGLNGEIKLLEYDKKLLDEKLNTIKNEALFFSKQLGIQNPLTFTDTSYSFDLEAGGDLKQIKLRDTIYNLLNQYQSKRAEFERKNAEIFAKDYQRQETLEEFNTNAILYALYIAIGLLFFFLGIYLWSEKEDIADQILKRQNLDKPRFSNFCQSCGKYFNSVIPYGIEKDKTNNYCFCINCYHNGQFVEPDLKLDEFISRIKIELTEKNVPEKKLKKVIKKIKNLERWKLQHYF